MAHHERDDRITLLRLQAGGMWTDAQQEAWFEGNANPKCSHCGGPMDDVFHLWECSGLADHRRKADEGLANAALHKLPKHLILGVPDFRPACINPLLGKIIQEGCAANWDLEEILNAGVDADASLKNAFVALDMDEGNLNIQEASYKLLAYSGQSPAPRVMHCNDRPPELPNVFTDGSYLHPGYCSAFATFGSWQPGRSAEEILEEECDFARIVQLPNNTFIDGILMAGAIPGVFSSSTRAELASVIAALPKPGPLHFALDNKAVVDGLRAIISGTATSKRPWALRPDGDLWSVAEEATAKRGAHSVTVQWTKGHATWQHIIDGIVSHRNAIAP